MKNMKKLLCICMMLCLTFAPAMAFADSDVSSAAETQENDENAGEEDAESDEEDASEEGDESDGEDAAEEDDESDEETAETRAYEEAAEDSDDGWSGGSVGEEEEAADAGIVPSEVDDSGLTYPLEKEPVTLLSYETDTIYMGEDLELKLDYSKYCSEDEVAGVYWNAWDDGDSYSLSDLPYSGALSDWGYTSECPYLDAEQTEDGILLMPERWWEMNISVLVVCTNGDYYWDSMWLTINEERSSYYEDVDLFNYRTEDYGVLYLEPGEKYHLDMSYLDYCTEDEVESVTFTAYNDLVDEKGEFHEDYVPQLIVEPDDTGYNLTGVLPEDDMCWTIVTVYVKLTGDREGYMDQLEVYIVDPNNAEDVADYDKINHVMIIDDGESGGAAADEAIAVASADQKQKTEETAKSTKKSGAPKTGEAGPSDEMMLLFLVAGAAAVVLLWKKGEKAA